MTIRHLLPVLAVLATAAGLRAQPLRVGDHKQLLIDDRLVTAAQGVAWTINPPVKLGVVLTGTNSWEDGAIGGYGTVLTDQGKLRMWYKSAPAITLSSDGGSSLLCYAESTDGVHWTKPNLGLYDWQGSKANNVVMEATTETAGVFIDPKAAPAERYKLVARLHERSSRWPTGTALHGTGLYLDTSPDGLHWRLHPVNLFPFDPDTLNLALYDDRTDQYLAYVRTWNPQRQVGVIAMDNIMAPWPYVRGVPPAVPGIVSAPTREAPEAFGPDANDPANLDFYTSAAVKYAYADDVYLMFPSPYRHFAEPPLTKYSNDGSLDISLAVSRDGRKFHRVSKQPYIPLGLAGTADSRTLYLFDGLGRHQDALYQYYAAYDFTHGGWDGLTEKRPRGAICAVRQRLDGFVSLDADPAGGSFITPALVFSGRRLELNLDASATGEIRVELQDANGQPLAGHSFADSDPVYRNDTAAVVTWQGKSDVSALAGQTVRVAFRMQAVRFYAFQFK